MSASGPRVTVLLSTYNGARWLPELIDSIEAQTFKGWQVLVRDDASRDATNDVLRSWARSSRRVELSAPSSRLGPSRSFMQLLGSLESEIFAFCDQDDVWHPYRLEAALEHFSGLDTAKDEVAVVSAVDLVDERLSPLPRSGRETSAERRELATGPLLLNNAAVGATMTGTAALARSAVRLARSDAVAMHDWWCALVASARGSLEYESRSTLRWRRHGATVTGASTPGLRWRLDRRRAYLLDARDMAQRILAEPRAIVSESVLSALLAVADTEPSSLSAGDYWRLGRAGVRATEWRHRMTLLAACVDPSATTGRRLGDAAP